MVFLTRPTSWIFLAAAVAFGAGWALGAEVAGIVGLLVALTGSEAWNRSRWLSRERCRWVEHVTLATSTLVPPSAYLAGVLVGHGVVTSYAQSRLWAAPLVAWGLSRLEIGSSARFGGLLLGCWVLPALLAGVAA